MPGVWETVLIITCKAYAWTPLPGHAASLGMLLALPSSFRAELLGAAKVEGTFQHQLPPKPDADGKLRCKACERTTIKSSLHRFRKSLCYGDKAKTRDEAIEATRAVRNLSHNQILPDDVMTQLTHLRLSSVTLDDGSPNVMPTPLPD